MDISTNNSANANEIIVDGTRDNVDLITEFIGQKLLDKNAQRRTVAQINVAVDELYSNIAQYAYDGEIGKIKVTVEFIDNKVKITFIDSGKPFNPLEKEDPDVDAGIEERGIGGLGIFIVKKTMDNIAYAYTGNQNILTIEKNLE